MPIRLITASSSRSAAGKGLLYCSVAWPAPTSASMTPALSTDSTIANTNGTPRCQVWFQTKSLGTRAAKTAAAQATEMTRRLETTRSHHRPAIALGKMPAMVAIQVTATTCATSGATATSEPRSIA
jgi:hypothetical protein